MRCEMCFPDILGLPMKNRFDNSAKSPVWPSRVLSCTVLAIAMAFARTSSAANQPDSPDFTELSLEQLMRIEVPSVTGASKFEQKETDAPASVSVVNADDIKKFGYRTLADILGSMRGLFVTYDRTYSFLGVRGFNRPGDFGGRVLLLIDGHRVNENIFDSALLGNEGVLDVDLIDHVEFIRGPSSSLYGNNAFFGVINVVTKSGRDFRNGEASIAAGSFDTYKGRFTLGRKLSNGFEYLLSGSFLD